MTGPRRLAWVFRVHVQLLHVHSGTFLNQLDYISCITHRFRNSSTFGVDLGTVYTVQCRGVWPFTVRSEFQPRPECSYCEEPREYFIKDKNTCGIQKKVATVLRPL